MSALLMVQTLTSYKAWANGVLFDALDAETSRRIDRFELVLRVLDHAHVVDCIFQAHLRGVPHDFAATRSPELPDREELERRVRALDRWFVDYAASASEEALAQPVEVRFTDGQVRTMTPAEMLVHVVNHWTNHRGNITALMQLNGLSPFRDGLPEFLDVRSARAG